MRREYAKRLKAEPAEHVVEISSTLIANRRVPRFIGDELIASRPDALAILDQGKLEQFGSGMASWDQVDCFAIYLSGPAWREGRISEEVIAAWARSKNRWWRRAALVSTVPLNVKARGGSSDARRTLAACELLVDDRDEMVSKALSWALRALAKRNAEAVEKFTEQHKARLAALVCREVRHKLATGRRNPGSR